MSFSKQRRFRRHRFHVAAPIIPHLPRRTVQIYTHARGRYPEELRQEIDRLAKQFRLQRRKTEKLGQNISLLRWCQVIGKTLRAIREHHLGTATADSSKAVADLSILNEKSGSNETQSGKILKSAQRTKLLKNRGVRFSSNALDMKISVCSDGFS